MAIVFIGKLTIESGEHGESALQVCLFLPLSTYETKKTLLPSFR